MHDITVERALQSAKPPSLLNHHLPVRLFAHCQTSFSPSFVASSTSPVSVMLWLFVVHLPAKDHYLGKPLPHPWLILLSSKSFSEYFSFGFIWYYLLSQTERYLSPYLSPVRQGSDTYTF